MNNRNPDSRDTKRAIDDLMSKARSCLVMEKFMSRLGHIDRVMG